MKGFRQPAGAAQVELDFERAVELQMSGRLKEADALLTAILKKSPWHFGSLHTLGVIRLQQTRSEEALTLFRKAVTSNPGSAGAHLSLGNTLQALGRHEEAVERYQRALALRPHDAHAQNNLGNSYLALRRLEEAAECFRQAVARQPGLDAAHGNLGNTWLELNRPEEALRAYEAALALNPRVAATHSNRGRSLAALGRHQEAIAAYEAGLALEPRLAGIHSNLGRTLVALNQHEEALLRFARARELDPEDAQHPLSLGVSRLALGEYAAGWPDYEARWRSPRYPLPRTYPQPRWDGSADVAGKTIFLYFEQGLGDTIQFVRYAPLLAERGARVVLEAPKGLLRLFRSLEGVADLLGPGDPPPDFDFHAPLLSLPLAFQTRIENIPGRVPYLNAAAVRTETSIGLCWAGNPGNSNDQNRSIPLRELIPLLEVPGVRFLSLQKMLRDGDDAILRAHANVDIDTDRKGMDFADTAALIAGLDLVITVDTAVAHLAGALGKPVWVLLPFSAHWAWLRDREDSPWYPTATLFRQPRPGEWRSVVERAAHALGAQAAGSTPIAVE
jgi:tetratricopeptide (TPR) repeat protein